MNKKTSEKCVINIKGLQFDYSVSTEVTSDDDKKSKGFYNDVENFETESELLNRALKIFDISKELQLKIIEKIVKDNFERITIESNTELKIEETKSAKDKLSFEKSLSVPIRIYFE